jgi:hypothetical protein
MALAVVACADASLPAKTASDPSNASAPETPYDPSASLVPARATPPLTPAGDGGAHEHLHHHH